MSGKWAGVSIGTRSDPRPCRNSWRRGLSRENPHRPASSTPLPWASTRKPPSPSRFHQRLNRHAIRQILLTWQSAGAEGRLRPRPACQCFKVEVCSQVAQEFALRGVPKRFQARFLTSLLQQREVHVGGHVLPPYANVGVARDDVPVVAPQRPAMALGCSQLLACAAIVDGQQEAVFKSAGRVGNPPGSGRAHLAAKAVGQPGADFGQQPRSVRRRRIAENL